MILKSSAEAATYKTNVEGWVSRHGRFYGPQGEDQARYDGCTHVECADCGVPVSKVRLFCDACNDSRLQQRLDAMPVVEWDLATPIYSHTADQYFFDADQLNEYCDEYEIRPEDLRLVLCRPETIWELDPAEIYEDILGDDIAVPAWLEQAFEILNATIREKREPVVWEPGKVRVTIERLTEGET